MQTQTRYDVFEEGDLTSLVCIDDPGVQTAVFEQLGKLNYKIHTGLFSEDVALKLQAHNYDLVAVYEHFNDWDIATNQILKEAVNVPPEQRRKQFVALIGPGMTTGDAMQAFIYSADLVLGLSDLKNFGTVLSRSLARHKEFYAGFNECLRMAGML